jgi:hypothetical protein
MKEFLMKRSVKLFGIIALAMLIGTATACDTNNTGGSDPAENRLSFVSGEYELVIHRQQNSPRAAFEPRTGDFYYLLHGIDRVSWGTVRVDGNTLEFFPASNAGSAESFTATMTGTTLSIDGNVIVLDDGTPAIITPMEWGPSGTWVTTAALGGTPNGTITIVVTGTFESGNWTFNFLRGACNLDPCPCDPCLCDQRITDFGTYSASGNTYIARDRTGTRILSYGTFINVNRLDVEFTAESGFPGRHSLRRH